ncbi:YhcH/YjgK/YiaL family protein [Photobacterium sanctipauli]|uniref:YhcH/YjgK/YiaL family protein n=1 Tax=Photobacterium sanctipauli TaxID=1342794 RepID=A0A2T3P0J1_9GAMM|nr:YhcH/YjgK/YiaL family protein [Photobacterium sanctipauli]PSW22044.1 YhcH/YjgK/YiaL family protein [Photobacterium sanctipauli]
MIKGNLNSIDNHRYLDEKIIDIIKVVKKRLVENDDCGHYSIIGDKAFFFVVDDHTQLLAERRCEIHKRYIDVQILLAGHECFGYSLEPFLSISEDCLLEKDVAFSEDIVDEKFTCLQAGDFVVFDTLQPHRPLVAVDNPMPVKKAVVKIDKSLI